MMTTKTTEPRVRRTLELEGLTIVDRQGRTRVEFGTWDEPDGGPLVSLLNAQGNVVLGMGLNEAGRPGITLHDGERLRLRIWLDRSGTPAVSVNDANGKLVAELALDGAIGRLREQALLTHEASTLDAAGNGFDLLRDIGDVLKRHAGSLVEVKP